MRVQSPRHSQEKKNEGGLGNEEQLPLPVCDLRAIQQWLAWTLGTERGEPIWDGLWDGGVGLGPQGIPRAV